LKDRWAFTGTAKKSLIMKNRFLGHLQENAGILFVVVLSFLALFNTLNYQDSLELLNRAKRTGRWMSYSLIRYEEQWDCLRNDLRPDSIIGFVTPLPPFLAIEYYQLTQYTLSPVVVDNSENYALVLGYAPNPGDFETLKSRYPNLRVVKQCNEEVFLFRREN
jgi:hypothetical protein